MVCLDTSHVQNTAHHPRSVETAEDIGGNLNERQAENGWNQCQRHTVESWPDNKDDQIQPSELGREAQSGHEATAGPYYGRQEGRNDTNQGKENQIHKRRELELIHQPMPAQGVEVNYKRITNVHQLPSGSIDVAWLNSTSLHFL